jgi:hypothetical protein
MDVDDVGDAPNHPSGDDEMKTVGADVSVMIGDVRGFVTVLQALKASQGSKQVMEMVPEDLHACCVPLSTMDPRQRPRQPTKDLVDELVDRKALTHGALIGISGAS